MFAKLNKMNWTIPQTSFIDLCQIIINPRNPEKVRRVCNEVLLWALRWTKGKQTTTEAIPETKAFREFRWWPRNKVGEKEDTQVVSWSNTINWGSLRKLHLCFQPSKGHFATLLSNWKIYIAFYRSDKIRRGNENWKTRPLLQPSIVLQTGAAVNEIRFNLNTSWSYILLRIRWRV